MSMWSLKWQFRNKSVNYRGTLHLQYWQVDKELHMPWPRGQLYLESRHALNRADNHLISPKCLIVGDGGGTEEEKEGDRHPPHGTSPPTFQRSCASRFPVACSSPATIDKNNLLLFHWLFGFRIVVWWHGVVDNNLKRLYVEISRTHTHTTLHV